ncbi:MAG TPA: TIGR03619 family F420-dependent LLM class oxidoreductase [Microthrixaceae bacterium]|nr:TIGR03619 family F420-dependent LLM class oxidoreductase [Microthrixaceae bacterium]
MKVRVGFGLGARTGVDDQARYRLLVDELERLRFDSLWVSERIGAPGPDPTVAMAMAAARTDRLKFGMSVMVLPGRNPVVLAKEMASLDVLSAGRLVPAFGLGAPQLAEHQAFGVRREDRASIFDEALGLMRRLWTEDDPVTHEGKWFQAADVTVLPKPAQRPLDVWLGGIAPSELRRVGRLADGWLPSFVTTDDVRDGIARVREVADANDREIDPEHFGVLIPYANAPIDERVLAFVAARRPEIDPGQLVARTLDDLVAMIGRFVEVGASKFVAVPFAPLDDVTAELEALSAAVAPLES